VRLNLYPDPHLRWGVPRVARSLGEQMRFFNHCLGQVECSDPPKTNHSSGNCFSLNRSAPNHLAAPNHLVPNRLALIPPAPLLKTSASMMVGILTGSITQVRVLNSRPPLRSSLDPNQPGVAGLTHPFTREMITNLTCGYCNSRLNSMNDLRYHLSNVRYHGVFSCCGRFFKREVDLERHRTAKFVHNHEVTRNVQPLELDWD